MAGTVDITFSKIDTPYASTHGVVKVLIEWTADSGDGSVPETAFDATDTIGITGRYCSLGVTDPGTTAPTANYDIEILDEYGCDIFGGNFNNRSASDSEQTLPVINNGLGSRLCAGILTFKLTNNSVNSATGKCILYFEL